MSWPLPKLGRWGFAPVYAWDPPPLPPLGRCCRPRRTLFPVLLLLLRASRGSLAVWSSLRRNACATSSRPPAAFFAGARWSITSYCSPAEHQQRAADSRDAVTKGGAASRRSGRQAATRGSSRKEEREECRVGGNSSGHSSSEATARLAKLCEQTAATKRERHGPWYFLHTHT